MTIRTTGRLRSKPSLFRIPFPKILSGTPSGLCSDGVALKNVERQSGLLFQLYPVSCWLDRKNTMDVQRVALISDLREEGWPSMDMIADMLLRHLDSGHSDSILPTLIRPLMRRRFTRAGVNRDEAST